MNNLIDVYQRLLDHFGPQHWWPGESPFEVIVGAVLTQNTSWKNVELALAALRRANALRADRIDQLTDQALAELIRPAGYYRVKARRLKNLVHYLMTEYAGSVEALFAVEWQVLRRQLLQVNGIGPETADAILLYAGHKPVFVVDVYTARWLKRHAWIDPEADYHQIQSLFVDTLPMDVPMFNDFHALIVRLGKTYCRKQPQCEGCPLEPLLPVAGPQLETEP